MPAAASLQRLWEVPGRQLAGVRVAVLGWDSGGGCARILGKGGNLLRECGGARGFYLHVKHFSWISSVAVSPVYRPAHPRVWPGQTVCWRQPPHISSQLAQHRVSRPWGGAALADYAKLAMYRRTAPAQRKWRENPKTGVFWVWGGGQNLKSERQITKSEVS